MEVLRGFGMVLCDLKGITQVLTRFYGDLRVWEASGRAPGGSPGTFSERLNGFERFLEVLSGFGMVLGSFQRDLRGFGRISGGPGGGCRRRAPISGPLMSIRGN